MARVEDGRRGRLVSSGPPKAAAAIMASGPPKAAAAIMALGAGMALALAGCQVPVAGNLEESDANQAMVVLERGGVASAKESDAEHEGRFRVSVARGDAPSAIGLLAAENLPPRPAPGVLEALGQGSVVPSRLAERARWSTGVAGDLERSLRAVDGMLSVRVHLALPAEDALTPEAERQAPSASVLLRHRGATPPVAAGDVQRLVAGAVPGLLAERVSVVAVPSAAAGLRGEALLAFGPLTVSKGSAPTLRWLVAGVAALNLVLVAAVLSLWLRVRRAEGAARAGEAAVRAS